MMQADRIGALTGEVSACFRALGCAWSRLILPSVALLFSLQMGGAQNTTDFSGVWKMDPSRSESAHQAAPIGPVTLIIKQDAAELSIETRRAQKQEPAVSSETLRFKLDGSENTITGSFGAEVQAKAHWDGTKLVTETSRNIQGSTVTTMHVFSLDPSGKELTIDKTLTVQHGYQSEGARNTGTGKDVFIKSLGSVKSSDKGSVKGSAKK